MCTCPASMLCQGEESEEPGSSPGMLAIMVATRPSCPAELYPQQYAAPSDVVAHVWISPALTDAQVDGAGAAPTETGVRLLVEVPSPSWR